jgi:Myb/SANT-like DNA-binding domain
MATRSKQSGSESDNPKVERNIKVSKERAHWTSEDETALVACLLKHKLQGVKGDGANFKNVTWNQVAKEMNEIKTKGGEKTVSSCTTKWARVHQHINIVLQVFLFN